MEMLDSRELPVRRGRRTPSFASTLLDDIYRSIDEVGNGETNREDQSSVYTKKQSTSSFIDSNGFKEGKREIGSLRLKLNVDKWMERQVNDVSWRNSLPDVDVRVKTNRCSKLLNSASSSSESSCGRAFSSSSETESGYRATSRSSTLSAQILKTVRTGPPSAPSVKEKSQRFDHKRNRGPPQHQTPNHEGGGRFMRIYGDWKKSKQPISPGARITSFLNSLFTSGNSKKAEKFSSSEPTKDTRSKPYRFKSAQASSCTSAGSFSTSCLGKKLPSSKAKFGNNGTKRSVNSYPVSVIMDKACRPCSHKILYDYNQNIIQVTADKTTQKHATFQRVEAKSGYVDSSGEEEDEDDAESCSSSDLFELNSLGAIAINRYKEELPVYGSTNLHLLGMM